MVDCNKRQRELYKGTERHRCIHPEAETTGEIVPLSVCELCPLVNLVKIKTCKDQHTPDPVTIQPTEQIALPVLDDPEFPQCPYRYNGSEGNVCSITNLGVTPEICYRCSAETEIEERKNQAKMGTKVMNYFGAIRRWVASGRPTRTEEEMKDLFETHCKNCEMYDKEKHACKSCGCNVSPDADPLQNKLAMATEHCPLGRF